MGALLTILFFIIFCSAIRYVDCITKIEMEERQQHYIRMMKRYQIPTQVKEDYVYPVRPTK